MLLCFLPPDAEIQPYSLKPFLLTEVLEKDQQLRGIGSPGAPHLPQTKDPPNHRTS